MFKPFSKYPPCYKDIIIIILAKLPEEKFYDIILYEQFELRSRITQQTSPLSIIYYVCMFIAIAMYGVYNLNL